MLNKTCFFIGHRDAPEELFPILMKSVEKHVTQFNVNCFVVGRYGNFDRMAATAVQVIKKRHSFVTLTLLLPYHPGERIILLPDGFDDSLYPPEMERVPKQLAILRANQYMIQHSDFLITYSWNTTGNTFKFLKQAQKRAQNGNLIIENLAKSSEYFDNSL